MATRKGSAEWRGDLKGGPVHGQVAGGQAGLPDLPRPRRGPRDHAGRPAGGLGARREASHVEQKGHLSPVVALGRVGAARSTFPK